MNIPTEIMLDLENERLISTGLLAERVSSLSGQHCTPEMIYNYEKHGLVQHAAKTKGGFRQFFPRDIHTVVQIKRWQAEGLSLAQIKERLDSHPEGITVRDISLEIPDDRRTQILKASAKIFPQKGYQATTMQDIADEAEIAPSLIYQFYRSKEELFLAFTENTSFRNILDLITASLERNEAMSYADVRQSLIDVAVNFTRDHASKVELYRLLISTVRNFPEIGRHYLHNFIEPTEAMLENYFDHLVKQEVFRPIDTKIAARMFFGIFADFSLSRNFYSANETPIIPDEEDVIDMVDLFLGSLVYEKR